MSDDEFQRTIDRLNAGKADDIVLRPISRNVCFAILWGDAEDSQPRGLKFFFIRKSGAFVAALHWFGREEMEWYVTPSSRRKGILVKPLRQTILPYIFQHLGAEFQQCTVRGGEFAEASEKLAHKVGFRACGERGGKTLLQLNRPKTMKRITPPKMKVSLADIEALDRETQRALRSVGIIADRLRLQHEENSDAPAYGDFSDGMKATLGEVAEYADKMRWKIKARSTPST